MRIHALLPRDRARPGRLFLLDATGLLMLDVPCLGRADAARALAAGNPTRDPVKPYGDTPIGVYHRAAVREFAPEHKTLGRYAIPLVGAGGQALAAMRARTELYIHATPSGDGARGKDRLIPTYGCLRLLDDDMAMLVVKMGGPAPRGRAAAIEIDEEREGV